MPTVIGGPRGIHANLDDLEQAAGMLKDIVMDAQMLVTRTAGWGGLSALVTSGTSQGPLLAMKTGQLATGITVLQAETVVLREGVVFAAESYRHVESVVNQKLDRLMTPISTARVLFDVATGQRVSNADLQRVVGNGSEMLLSLLDRVGPAGGGAILRMAYIHFGTAYQQANDVSVDLHGGKMPWTVVGMATDAMNLFNVGPYEVTATNEATGWVSQGEAGGNITDMVARARETEASAAGEGQIRADRIERADGTTFVVTIPGTQFAVPEVDATGIARVPAWLEKFEFESAPWGATGLIESMTLESQHVTDAVLEILAEAGAEPGADVIFAGYSQGGTHATNVANSAKIHELYNVPLVVTQGALNGNIDVPLGTQALHFDHEEDIASALDGTPNTAAPNITTVMFNGYADGVDPHDGTFGGAHKLDNYEALIAEVEADPIMRERIGPPLATLNTLTTGTVSSKFYTLTRQPVEPPRNPLLHRSRASSARF